MLWHLGAASVGQQHPTAAVPVPSGLMTASEEGGAITLDLQGGNEGVLHIEIESVWVVSVIESVSAV